MNKLFKKYLQIIQEMTLEDSISKRKEFLNKELGSNKFYIKYYPEMDMCILTTKKPQAIHNYVLEFEVGDFLKNFKFDSQKASLNYLGAQKLIGSREEPTPVINITSKDLDSREYEKIAKKLNFKKIRDQFGDINQKFKTNQWSGILDITNPYFLKLAELKKSRDEAKERYSEALVDSGYNKIEQDLMSFDSEEEDLKYKIEKKLENIKTLKNKQSIAKIQSEIGVLEKRLEKFKYEKDDEFKRLNDKFDAAKKIIHKYELDYEEKDSLYATARDYVDGVMDAFNTDTLGESKMILLRTKNIMVSKIHEGLENFAFSQIFVTQNAYKTLINRLRFSNN
jgi:hypothetical protein